MFLKSVINSRDLGGIKIGDKTVKEGLLFRTAHLHDISDQEVKILQEKYKLKRIFDLRSIPEAALMPDKEIPGAQLVPLPTLDTEAEKQSGEAIPEEMWLDLPKHIVRLSFMKMFQKKAKDLYPSLILSEFSQLQYATLMNLLLETEDGSVLWHCSQGKDRTGIAAALILGALGADRETIVKDFDRSNEAYKPLVEKLCAAVEKVGGGEEEKEVIRAFMGVSVRNFNHALDIIEANWGSIQGYLEEQMAIGPEEIKRLQERYLV